MVSNPNAKSSDSTGKKKHKQRPTVSREERRAKSKAKKEEKTGNNGKATPIREIPGFTFGQLEAMNPSRKPTGPSTAEIFQNDFCEALAAVLDQKFMINRGNPDQHQLQEIDIGEEQSSPDVGFEDTITQAALRNVVWDEIPRLLAGTQALFDGLQDSPEMAETIAAVMFEEGSPFDLEIAEILISDSPAEAIADFLGEVGSKIYELQLVAGSLDPNYELGHSIDLGLIQPDLADRLTKAVAEEAEQIGLRLRFKELSVSDGKIDETLAGMIDEGKKAAETQQRDRAASRQNLTKKLREWKQKERRPFSRPSEKSDDEDLVYLLLEHRGDLTAVLGNLPLALREQVKVLLRDEERRGPILRQIADIKSAAQRHWVLLQSRLMAGANQPEETVTSNLRLIKVLREELARIRQLGTELKRLDEPKRPVEKRPVEKADHSHSRPQPSLAMAMAFEKLQTASQSG